MVCSSASCQLVKTKMSTVIKDVVIEQTAQLAVLAAKFNISTKQMVDQANGKYIHVTSIYL